MASTINFRNHVKRFNETMRGMARILYVGAGYNLTSYPALIGKYWSRIYTTSQDTELAYLFSRSDRQVRAISSIDTFRASNTILDRKNPLLIYLGSDSVETDDVRQKLEQRESQQALCATLSQILYTDLVSLVIVGYDPSIPGELSTAEMGKMLMKLSDKRVTFYGLREEVEADPYIKMLVHDGIATVFTQDLGEALETLSADEDTLPDEDAIPLSTKPEDLSNTVYIADQLTQLEQNLCYEFARYGRLLSIKTMDTGIISRMMQVEYFYRFLKRSPYEPQWYGYNPRNCFAVHRKFEDDLYTAVSTALNIGATQPIILAGQTGSGKSVALAALAYRIFQERKYPVVFITNPNVTFAADTPSFLALDNLLIELERQGAARVLVILDYSVYNLQRSDGIRRLMDRCINRGRKIVIVASAMKQAETIDKGQTATYYTIVESPIDLLPEERKRFRDLVVDKGKLSSNSVERWMRTNTQDNNLLSMLYRLVWDLHPQLEHGMNAEITKGLEDTRNKLLELPVPSLQKEPLSSIAAQLVALGLIEDPNTETPASPETQQQHIVSGLQSFCESLAVSSLFKLRMPITMAMRLMKIPMCSNRQLYRDVVFNSPWLNSAMDDDKYAQGEYYVTFRTPMDARIYLGSLNASENVCMGIVAKTILSLKDDSSPFYNDEIKFLEQLIRMIGPNSDDNSVRDNWFYTYGAGCSQVIDALAELRKDNISEPQLVAQEITYIREYYGNDKEDIETRVHWLECAIRIARQMLDVVARPGEKSFRWKPGLIDSITVESIFSELRLEQAYRDANKNGITITHTHYFPEFTLDSFVQRQQKLLDVIRTQPENSYAYTALLSCYNFYHSDPTISWENKLNKLADVLEVVDKVAAGIPSVETNESYQKKKVDFVDIFDYVSGSDSAAVYFQRLLKMGSAVGIYMRARTMLRKANIRFGELLDNGAKGTCKAALDLLEDPQYSSIVKAHAGCQYMRLQLRWLYCNREPIFFRELQNTFMTRSDWSALYSICAEFKANIIDSQLDCSYVTTVCYIMALAAAQLGDYDTAVNTWKLVHENDFHTIGRQSTWHILCESDGEPILFSGTFNTRYPLPERRIYINEMQRPVLYPSLQSLNKSEPVGEAPELCIGTSYRGFSAFTKSWAKRRS